MGIDPALPNYLGRGCVKVVGIGHGCVEIGRGCVGGGRGCLVF